MKHHAIFHEANALALGSSGYDDSRLTFRFFSLGESGQDLVEVVSTYVNDMPAKGSPLPDKRLKVHDVGRPSAELHAIAVDYSCEVIQVKVGCCQSCFPGLSLLTFSKIGRASCRERV
jgi:hypothetical protein